ncbi:DNA glycosylase [Mytilinidion resinicola]|uniref:DNA glycosylase n=1 Tax=Mytilinidion resinicola TaxID=574789 RepID=A0A6A6YKG0_9PEZI|nr:DNA glycosylase [Mytilinidion resinicola]KAF2809311.1 DNA glycosylase [Mytilinidion resinicola]
MALRRSTRRSTGTAGDVPEPIVQNGTPKSTTAKKPKTASTKAPAASQKRKPAASKKRKPAASPSSPIEPSKSLPEPEPEFTAPTTPTAKRRRTQPAKDAPKPPPITPTPSGIGLMVSSSPIPFPSNISTKQKPRPAEPHATNAVLSTPGGSRVSAYTSSPVKQPSLDAVPEEVPEAEPTPKKAKRAKKAAIVTGPALGVPPPTSTTETLLQDACAHLLKVDPKLAPVIEQHHCKMFSPEGLQEVVEPFQALASGIIGQQVSGAAAASIKRKFITLFPPSSSADSTSSFPAPALVASTPLETLRTAGLSQRKAEYIQGLAQKFASGELSAQKLASATDDEVMEMLIAVRGLGRWSVEMFACFSLKRCDVFSTGDLGVQRGMAAYVGKDVAKLKGKGGKWKYMSEQDMLDMAAKFSPYRSLFMWYMWRIEDVDVSVMQGT